MYLMHPSVLCIRASARLLALRFRSHTPHKDVVNLHLDARWKQSLNIIGGQPQHNTAEVALIRKRKQI
jgi:hypothetical protein